MIAGPLGALQAPLEGAGHPMRIQIIVWHLQTHNQAARVWPADVQKVYSALSLAPPSSFSGYFQQLVKQKTLLKDGTGYRLESSAARRVAAQFSDSATTIQITHLLASLPEKVKNLEERTYLNEALICYKNGAFRAAVVMTWNLAFHHLCSHVLAHALKPFNDRWQVSYPGHHKKGTREIATMDDFARELRESEVIEICRTAKIITDDVGRILSEKLGRRNSAAHPSSVIVGQLQVDALIDDLVKNVVLRLA